LPTTIREWQERAVRLDRNQRQSRAEERILGGIQHTQEEMGSQEENMGEDHMREKRGK